MDIFESLENLNVSEGCFEDIIKIVEEYINELKNSTIEKTLDAHRDRVNDSGARGAYDYKDSAKYHKALGIAKQRARKKGQNLEFTDRGKHIHTKLIGIKDGVGYYQRMGDDD